LDALLPGSDFFIGNQSAFDFNIVEHFPVYSHFEPSLPYSDLTTDMEPSPTRLQEYSMPMDCSRSASPGAQAEHDKWIQGLGKIEKMRYDPEVLNVFLNLFRVHVVSTFRCFEKFAIISTTPLELCLAMAGVGALYCSTPGANKVAKSLYNSTRVKLLSKVLAKTLGAETRLNRFISRFIINLCHPAMTD
jgi:hypothetical protein